MIEPKIDFHSLALEIEDALFASELNETELRVARLIVKLSLRSGRTTTPQLLQQDFGLLAGIRKTHIRQALGWLLGKKIIEVERLGVYRPNTDIKTWLVEDRITPQARDREAELLRDAAQVEFFPQRDIRAGDHRVALADAAVDVAAESSEFRNQDRAGQAVKVTKFGTVAVAELRNSELATTAQRDACVRAPTTCSVASSSKKHGHDHVHAPSRLNPDGATAPSQKWTPAKQDLLDQVEELVAREGRFEQYRNTWQLRILDWETAVFKTIGEVRVMVRERRIKSSIGGALNFHFKLFRESSRKALKKVATMVFI